MRMEGFNMGLKNKIYFFAIGEIMIFSCGCTQKNIDDEYLIISDVSTISHKDSHYILALRIKGDYAESAWGIKQINHKTVGNIIVLFGTLEFGGQGTFEYEVNIPPYVDIVKFYNRVLWTRHQADNQP